MVLYGNGVENLKKGEPTSMMKVDMGARANVTKDLLKKFNWDVFDHPPYSPDLAPSDFHLFQELKAWLGGQSFAANDELQDAIKTYLSSLAANFFAEGIEKLVSRYDKCLNRFGDYVEK